jgi:hypothetical protein
MLQWILHRPLPSIFSSLSIDPRQLDHQWRTSEEWHRIIDYNCFSKRPAQTSVEGFSQLLTFLLQMDKLTVSVGQTGRFHMLQLPVSIE